MPEELAGSGALALEPNRDLLLVNIVTSSFEGERDSGLGWVSMRTPAMQAIQATQIGEWQVWLR